MAQQSKPAWVKALITALAVTALLSILLMAFALPGVHSRPHDLKLGIVGQNSSNIAASLEKQQPGAFDLSTPQTSDQARAQIVDRSLDGAIVLSPQGVTSLVATAGSPAVSTIIRNVGSALAEKQNVPSTIVDLRSYGSDDPNGVGLAAGALPLALGGWIGAMVIMLTERRMRALVSTLVLFAVLGGIVLTSILSFVVGTFDAHYVEAGGVAILSILATAFAVVGLRTALGNAGLGVAALCLIILGNPLSGLSSSPKLLPQPWGAIGQLLPPGAAGSALRNVVFFNGHGSAMPLTVLAVWLIGGIALLAIGHRHAQSKAAAQQQESAKQEHDDPEVVVAT